MSSIVISSSHPGETPRHLWPLCSLSSNCRRCVQLGTSHLRDKSALAVQWIFGLSDVTWRVRRFGSQMAKWVPFCATTTWNQETFGHITSMAGCKNPPSAAPLQQMAGSRPQPGPTPALRTRWGTGKRPWRWWGWRIEPAGHWNGRELSHWNGDGPAGKHHNEHSQQTTNEQTNEKKKQRHTPLQPPRTITRSPVEWQQLGALQTIFWASG